MPGMRPGLRYALVVAGGVVTIVATALAGSWQPPAALILAVVVAAVVLTGLVLWLARRAAWIDRGLAAVFFAWLYGVPFLLGVGLLRRGENPPVLFSFEGAQAYAARTDALMIWGLVLNAVLPLTGAFLAWGLRPRWLRWFGLAGAGAAVFLLGFAIIAAQADTHLFGRLPRWEKP
jgi:hypothetical protein